MSTAISRASTVLGVIDWAKTRSTPCSFTFDEVALYTLASLDPHVVQTAQVLCSQLVIAEDAKKQLAATWETQLAGQSAKDKGSNAILSLAASDPGSTFLGICAAINSYYRKDTVPVVFETLVKMAMMPKDLCPQFDKWIELAHICENLHLPSSFEDMVHEYTQLGQQNSGSAGYISLKNSDEQLEHTGPLRLLENLQIMSDFCTGREEQQVIAFVGSDAGWFAAVAVWFFKLRIEIQGTDGSILFSNNSNPAQLSQFILRFHNRGVPCEGDPVADPPLPVKAAC